MAKDFITGFANALSEGIKRSDESARAERRDLLRASYDDLARQAARREEEEAKDKKNIQAAKTYASMLGMPEDAWPELVPMIRSGVSFKDLKEAYGGGTWEKIESPKGVEAPAESAQDVVDPRKGINAPSPQEAVAQTDPAAAQTQSALGASPQATAPAVPQPQTPEGPKKNPALNNPAFLMNASGKFKDVRGEASKKYAAATGRTPEQMERMSTPYEPQTFGSSGYRFIPGQPQLDLSSPNKAFEIAGRATIALQNNPNDQEARRQLDLARSVIEQSQQAAVGLEQAKIDHTNKYISGGIKAVFGVDGQFLGERRPGEIVMAQGPDGQPVMMDTVTNQPIGAERPITPHEMEQRTLIAQTVDKSLEPVRQRADGAEAALRSFAIAESIVERSPAVLQGVTSSVSERVDKLFKEVDAMSELIKNSFGQNKMPDVSVGSLEASSANLQQFLQSSDLTANERLAAETALFNAQKNIMAYHIGRAFNQEGRSLAEAERLLFTEMASKGKDADTYKRNMANIFVPIIEGIDADAKRAVDNNSLVKEFFAVYGYTPKAAQVPSIKEVMMNSGGVVADAFKKLLPYMDERTSDTHRSEQPQETPTNRQEGDIPPAPEGVDADLWQYMTPEERSYFQ